MICVPARCSEFAVENVGAYNTVGVEIGKPSASRTVAAGQAPFNRSSIFGKPTTTACSGRSAPASTYFIRRSSLMKQTRSKPRRCEAPSFCGQSRSYLPATP
jgi:hypothetical protein